MKTTKVLLPTKVLIRFSDGAIHGGLMWVIRGIGGVLRLEEASEGQGMDGFAGPFAASANKPLCCLIRERPVNA